MFGRRLDRDGEGPARSPFEHFSVFMQYCLFCICVPGFSSLLRSTRNTHFLVSVDHIFEKVNNTAEGLAAGSASWNEPFRKALAAFPRLQISPEEDFRQHRCSACKRVSRVRSAQLSGVRYNAMSRNVTLHPEEVQTDSDEDAPISARAGGNPEDPTHFYPKWKDVYSNQRSLVLRPATWRHLELWVGATCAAYSAKYHALVHWRRYFVAQLAVHARKALVRLTAAGAPYAITRATIQGDDEDASVAGDAAVTDWAGFKDRDSFVVALSEAIVEDVMRYDYLGRPTLPLSWFADMRQRACEAAEPSDEEASVSSAAKRRQRRRGGGAILDGSSSEGMPKRRRRRHRGSSRGAAAGADKRRSRSTPSQSTSSSGGDASDGSVSQEVAGGAAASPPSRTGSSRSSSSDSSSSSSSACGRNTPPLPAGVSLLLVRDQYEYLCELLDLTMLQHTVRREPRAERLEPMLRGRQSRQIAWRKAECKLQKEKARDAPDGSCKSSSSSDASSDLAVAESDDQAAAGAAVTIKRVAGEVAENAPSIIAEAFPPPEGSEKASVAASLRSSSSSSSLVIPTGRGSRATPRGGRARPPSPLNDFVVSDATSSSSESEESSSSSESSSSTAAESHKASSGDISSSSSSATPPPRKRGRGIAAPPQRSSHAQSISSDTSSAGSDSTATGPLRKRRTRVSVGSSNVPPAVRRARRAASASSASAVSGGKAAGSVSGSSDHSSQSLSLSSGAPRGGGEPLKRTPSHSTPSHRTPKRPAPLPSMPGSLSNFVRRTPVGNGGVEGLLDCSSTPPGVLSGDAGGDSSSSADSVGAFYSGTVGLGTKVKCLPSTPAAAAKPQPVEEKRLSALALLDD